MPNGFGKFDIRGIFKKASGGVDITSQQVAELGTRFPDISTTNETAFVNAIEELGRKQGVPEFDATDALSIASTDVTKPTEAKVPFKTGLDPTQEQGITNLIESGRKFNATDAANFAFSVGVGNPQEFEGLTGQEALKAISGGALFEKLKGIPGGQEFFDKLKAGVEGLVAKKSVDITGGDTKTESGDEFDSDSFFEQFTDKKGITATDIFDAMGVSIPDEQDIINDLFDSAEFKLLQSKLGLEATSAEAQADVAKDILDSKFAGDRKALEDRLASAGLFFSGVRTTQVKSLIDNLAASKFDVDRKFASQLIELDFELKEAILDGVADLIQDAKANKKDAIAQLNKAGIAIVGDQLVPTLAATKEARIAETETTRLEFERFRLLQPLTANLKEYDFALRQGFGGDFLSFLATKAAVQRKSTGGSTPASFITESGLKVEFSKNDIKDIAAFGLDKYPIDTANFLLRSFKGENRTDIPIFLGDYKKYIGEQENTINIRNIVNKSFGFETVSSDVLIEPEQYFTIWQDSSNQYTSTQNGKLRAAGVDPTDRVLSDTLLFGADGDFIALKKSRETGNVVRESIGTNFFGGIWEFIKSKL